MKRNYQIGLLLIGIMLISTNVFSQRKKGKRQKIDKFFVGIDYGIYNSKLAVESDFTWEAFEKDRNKWENGKGKFYQFIVGSSINKNISLLSGLSFNSFEIVQTDGFGFWRCDPSFYGATEVVSEERIVNLKSIEIPIEVKYKFKYNQFNFYPSLGLRTIFYTDKRQEVDFVLDNGKIGDHQANDKELNHNRNSNFAFEIKAGASYRFLERYNLKLEPFYRMYLNQDEILEDYSKTKFRSLGVLMGIEYAIIYERK